VTLDLLFEPKTHLLLLLRAFFLKGEAATARGDGDGDVRLRKGEENQYEQRH
jgi:hypothetical protein